MVQTLKVESHRPSPTEEENREQYSPGGLFLNCKLLWIKVSANGLLAVLPCKGKRSYLFLVEN